MPLDDRQPKSKRRAVRLISGTAPRKASPIAWDPDKPPGGKLPPDATKAQAKAADKPQ